MTERVREEGVMSEGDKVWVLGEDLPHLGDAGGWPQAYEVAKVKGAAKDFLLLRDSSGATRFTAHAGNVFVTEKAALEALSKVMDDAARLLAGRREKLEARLAELDAGGPPP